MTAANPIGSAAASLRMGHPLGIDDETPIGTFIKHEFRALIPREAQEFVERIDRNYQRRLRDQAQIDRLAHLISRNEFPVARLLVVECPWDPGFPVKLADGAHTVEAIVRANRAVRASIIYWRCDHKSQWPRIWGSAGLDAKTRGWVDEARQIINCGGYDIAIHVPASDVNRFRNGAEMYHRYVSAEPIAKVKPERLEIVNQYPVAFQIFQKAVKDAAEKTLIQRPSTVAALVFTVEACREEIERLNRRGIRGANKVLDWPEQFWIESLSGMYEINDKLYPCYRLHQFLRQVNLTGKEEEERRGPNARKKSGAGKKDMIAACVNCWNAWLDGRKLKQVKTTTKGEIPPCQGAGMPRSYTSVRHGAGAEFFRDPLIVS